jgi:hypothetical protein
VDKPKRLPKGKTFFADKAVILKDVKPLDLNIGVSRDLVILNIGTADFFWNRRTGELVDYSVGSNPLVNNKKVRERCKAYDAMVAEQK